MVPGAARGPHRGRACSSGENAPRAARLCLTEAGDAAGRNGTTRPEGGACASLLLGLILRGGGPSPAASAPAAGACLRGASGPLLTDPGSFLVLADPVAPGAASGDVWGSPWHAREGPRGGTEALDRLFAAGALAPADRGG